MTRYSKDSDWVFASVKKRGGFRDQRRYAEGLFRPAAVAAGVISEGDRSRFGWHNLRHSLATFFGRTCAPFSDPTVLRHAKQQQLTLHSFRERQALEAQGLYLDAIKIEAAHPTSAKADFG